MALLEHGSIIVSYIFGDVIIFHTLKSVLVKLVSLFVKGPYVSQGNRSVDKVNKHISGDSANIGFRSKIGYSILHNIDIALVWRMGNIEIIFTEELSMSP